MTVVAAIHPEVLRDAIAAALGDKALRIVLDRGEVTVVVSATHYLA
ncbi:MAG TPA: NADH-quinone oxidoreductase subunit C, partial [Burkholderiaceae bacterium]